MKNATARGTIQFAMAVVIRKRGRSWDDSACDDHRDVAREPVHFAMAAIQERGRSWDDSACDDHRDAQTQPLMGDSICDGSRDFRNVAACETIQLVMIIMALKRSRSCDDSGRDGCRDSSTWPLV